MAECSGRKLSVNVGKSKIMRCAGEGGGDRLDVRLDGEMLGEVESSLKYWRSQSCSSEWENERGRSK